MKLPLRYFLAVSIFLGAIGLPWGYRIYQERREAEIERLEKEWFELWVNEPQLPFVSSLGVTGYADSPAHQQWEERMRAIEARLKKLTGKKPPAPVYVRPVHCQLPDWH